MGGIAGALIGWLLFAGMTLATGSVVVRWAILPRAADATPSGRDWLHRQAARAGSVGALALPVAIGLYFYRQLEEFRDPFAPWTEEATLLLSTDWGTSWKWAVAGGLAAPALFWAARTGRRWAWPIVTLVLFALAAFPAFTGHAAAAETRRALALALDTVHVWAASGWVGGLATLLYLEWQWRRAEPGGSLLPALVPAFTGVAITSVATLAVTGAVSAWTILPDLGALSAAGYGRVLLIKLALVVVVLVLGGLNFRVFTPRLGSAVGNTAMRRSATVELVVAQVVLVVTALLVRTSPTGH